MTLDPIERAKGWITVFFLAALALVWLVVFVREMVVRNGVDYGVDSALAAALTVIISGGIIVGRGKPDK